MRTLKHIYLIVFFSIAASSLAIHSQTIEKVRETTYRAYTEGKISLWEEAENLIRQEYINRQDSSSLYELLLVQYGYAAFCAKEKFKEKGLRVIEDGNSNVDLFLDAYPDDPGGLAIKAAFMVFEASLFPAKMISNGSESVKLSEKAYFLDKDKLLTLTGRANQLRFTPAIFGGSIDESIPLYKKIISYYDSGRYSTKNDWMYVNTLVILAGTYEKKKMYNEACGLYEKIVAYDDDINWINNSLYPECKAQLLKQK